MENKLEATALAELICTRVSHDIIGNIGAVSNAVELLEEGDLDFMDDIKSILKTSSTVLAARLKFFRMAFGLNNINLEKVDVVETTIRDYLKTIGNQNYPIGLELEIKHPGFCRVAMVGAMILADTLIRGGVITITENENAELSIRSNPDAQQSADKIKMMKDILEGRTQEISAQYAPMFYLLEVIKGNHARLKVADSSNLCLCIE